MFSINKERNLVLYFIHKVIRFLRYRIDRLSTAAIYYGLMRQMKKIGDEVIFDYGVKILNPSNTTIGSNVFIGRDTILNAYDSINIGDGCAIAAGCKLISGNHDVHNFDLSGGEIKMAPINLGNGVWLGYNVIVLSGVNLGKGCIVAAGSVVTKSFEEFSIVGGVPARLIRKREC